jgi:hypothetical protein
MTEKHALQVALEDARDSSGLEIRIRSYSGRGMFGAQCLAVTFDRDVSETEIVAEAMEQAALVGTNSIVKNAVKGARTDNMGLGTVLYWPNVPHVNDERDEDDED